MTPKPKYNSQYVCLIRYERLDEHMPGPFGNIVEDQYYGVAPNSGVEQNKAW